MENQKKTNKELLGKGVRILVASLLAIALGPIITYNAFMNKDHDLFIYVLIIGIVVMILAIFLIFLGIKTILSSLFDD